MSENGPKNLTSLRDAAERGVAEAQFELGVAYQHGQEVSQDYPEAAEWYRRSAGQGFAEAQFRLGCCYAQGLGLPKDHHKAINWYRFAADQENVGAQVNLGIAYQGQGVPPDQHEAVRWFRRAAEHGDLVGQHLLANMLADGHGVTQDFDEAVVWYRKSAEQGYAPAQLILGRFYAEGLGVPRNALEADKWYHLAANQGQAHPQLALGTKYIVRDGVPTNPLEATKWWRMAAEQGNADAQAFLGLAYVRGDGVLHDPILAHTWLSLAVAGLSGENRDISARERERLANVMLPAQIAEARQRASNWRPRVANIGYELPHATDPTEQQDEGPPSLQSSQDGENHDTPRFQRERTRGMFGFSRRTLTAEQISEKALGILSELLFRAAEENWSFAMMVESYYMGFKKSGAAVTNDLAALARDNEILCWIKLSEVPLLKDVRPALMVPTTAVPSELVLAALEIATQLTQVP